jgi:putative addiction module killer protein
METKIYKLPSGREPFTDWFDDQELKVKAIIFERLNRIRGGNFGSCKPITGYPGLFEIVIDFGPGYRIYYSKIDSMLIIILIAASKKSQRRDIEIAYRYLKNYREEQT